MTFNDNILRWWGIPLVTVLVTAFFWGDACLVSIEAFVISISISFLTTLTVWLGNAEIVKHLHHRFNGIDQTANRIIATVIASILYSSVSYTLVFLSVKWILNEPFDSTLYAFNLKVTFLFTALVTLIYEAFHFYYLLKMSLVDAEKLRKENLQAQLESLRTQVNPHFLFNSLNTLTALIPEKPTLAVEFVQHLSSVYRYLLSMKDKELIPLHTELEFIQSYIFLLKVRFGESILVTIHVKDSFLQKLLPPVSLQLLLENAIKHNVVSKEKPLWVDISVENDTLVVKNNLQKRESVEESTGTGLENIQKRYSILSDYKMEVIVTALDFIVLLPLLEIDSP